MHSKGDDEDLEDKLLLLPKEPVTYPLWLSDSLDRAMLQETSRTIAIIQTLCGAQGRRTMQSHPREAARKSTSFKSWRENYESTRVCNTQTGLIWWDNSTSKAPHVPTKARRKRKRTTPTMGGSHALRIGVKTREDPRTAPIAEEALYTAMQSNAQVNGVVRLADLDPFALCAKDTVAPI